MSTTTLALSVRQPWAWLILHGGKDVENRTWVTKVRGPILIHASAGMTREEYEYARRFADFVNGHTCRFPAIDELQLGGIVGSVEIVDCVPWSRSLWHEDGLTGFVLRSPKVLPFAPCKGRLGFFHPEILP
jgi:hypothetical protein